MQMWLDLSPTYHRNIDDCDDEECLPDGYSSDHPSPIHLPLDENDFQPLYVHPLVQAGPLHSQECLQNRWLVCNPTGTGRLAVLDAEAYRLFEQFRTPGLLQAVIAKIPVLSAKSIEVIVALLYKVGLLQRIDQPPLLHTEKLQSMSAWLHMTNECNLRCHYCYLGKNAERMDDDIAQRSVDAVFRSATKQHFKQVRLKYAGGEASLHMARVIATHKYAMQLAQQYDIELHGSILSNGVVLAQTAIDQLKKYHISIMISLDGIGAVHDSQRPFMRGHGSFQYIDRTINRLLANGVLPHISVTVSQRNLAGLSDLLLYILERDMPFTLNYYRDNTYVKDNYRDLQFSDQAMISGMQTAFKLIEHHLPRRSLLGSLIDKADLQSPHQRTCGVGQSYLVIDQHGQIAKCQADITRTVTTIDADDPLQIIKNDRSGIQGLSVEQKEGCHTCNWRYWCTGGCPHLTYRMTGRYDRKSPNCNIYMSLYPEALRLEGLRLLKYMTPVFSTS